MLSNQDRRRSGRTAAVVAMQAAMLRLCRQNAEKAQMIDLYCLTSPNVQKIFIMLEELELPYRQKQVDVWKSEQYDPEFAKLNPNRKDPGDR